MFKQFCFVTDQYEKIKKYHRDSMVPFPDSLLEQSNITRARTEQLLDERRDKFLQDLTAQNRSLNELQQKSRDLDEKVQHLSHKVSAAEGVIFLIFLPCLFSYFIEAVKKNMEGTNKVLIFSQVSLFNTSQKPSSCVFTPAHELLQHQNLSKFKNHV